jgi:DNA-binding response OmpR family regulator
MAFSVKHKILIVEDDDMSAELLSKYLTDNSFLVDRASNGDQGFIEFQKTDYSLIITDLYMPEMNGEELIKKIRAINLNIPIIVQSSNKVPEEIIEIMKLGVYDYFLKPYRKKELLNKIINAIESSILEVERKKGSEGRLEQIESEIDWYRYKEKNKNNSLNANKRYLQKKLFENLYRIFIQGGGIGAVTSLLDIVRLSEKNPDGSVTIDSEINEMLVENNEIVKKSFEQINKIYLLLENPPTYESISLYDMATLFINIKEDLKDQSKIKHQDIFISSINNEYKSKFVSADKELIRESFYELVLNALKFSKINSYITILFSIHKNLFNCSIISKPSLLNESDISIDQFNLIFEPFYRINNHIDERFSSLDFGLGMTMVEIIAERYKGKVSVAKLVDHTFMTKQIEEKLEISFQLPIEGMES